MASAYGQNDTSMQKNDTLPGRVYVLQKVDRNGVTLPEIGIKEVTIVGKQSKQHSQEGQVNPEKI